MNWLYYLAEANIYLGVFYLAYCLLLKKETYYQLNRAYLIFSCIISFILPVMQIGALKAPDNKTNLQAVVHYTLPEPAYTATQHQYVAPVAVTPIAASPIIVQPRFTLQNTLLDVYLLGAIILLLTLIVKLYTLFKLMRNADCVEQDKHKVVYLASTDVAFSFFNYLFIGTNAAGANTIIRHELVHIKQKHSADIIFLEVLKIINWFNPCIYLLQNSLKTVHEYIADEQTAAFEADALAYSSFLVNNAYGAGGSSITHSFFNYNLLKKRIIMLNQQRSGNLARLKCLVAVPICAALLCASTLAFSKSYGWIDLSASNRSALGVIPFMPAKNRLLKITQNGATTITDKFSVDTNGEQKVYTANLLTDEDKAHLLENNNIKIEVVDTALTADGRLPLPIVNADGYQMLDHYLHKNIHYRSAKDEKGGLVEVGFTLDGDRKITNAKIVKSGGSKLDALALNAFTSYKGIVNDDPGRNYKLGVYFFTDDYSIFKTDSLSNDREFAGELIITNYDYNSLVTDKGYEYDESVSGFDTDDKPPRTQVVMYEKNGDAKLYISTTATPNEVKLLKEKYGYTFPTGTANGITVIFNSKDYKKTIGFAINAASYLDAPYAKDFFNYVQQSVKYPEKEKNDLTAGLVILNFNLDNNGTISNVAVSKSAGKDFDDAAVNALTSYKSPIKDKAGKHSVAIVFCVIQKQLRPTVSQNFKTDGYVGELAISNVLSPFTLVRKS